jgi:hypothetical protein
LILALIWRNTMSMMTRRTVTMVSLAMASALLLAGCTSEKVEVLKSPCAGLEGSPCGPKRPVNGALNPHAQPAAPEHS